MNTQFAAKLKGSLFGAAMQQSTTTGWLQTTEIYPFLVLKSWEVQNQGEHWATLCLEAQGVLLYPLSALVVTCNLAFLVLNCITVSSASFITWHFLLCVPVPLLIRTPHLVD